MKTQQKTKEQKGIVCPECGMPQSEWPGKGIQKNDVLYCCRGCAEGEGCTCEEE